MMPPSRPHGAVFGRMRSYYVYILTNRSGTLYVGVTNDPVRRLQQHRAGRASSFTAWYRLDRLVFVETFSNPRDAIARETQLKRWSRSKRVRLVERDNPTWRDLSASWDAAAGVTGGSPERWAHRRRRGLDWEAPADRS